MSNLFWTLPWRKTYFPNNNKRTSVWNNKQLVTTLIRDKVAYVLNDTKNLPIILKHNTIDKVAYVLSNTKNTRNNYYSIYPAVVVYITSVF